MPERHDDRVYVCRVYDDATGGYRVLVDRLWPRGFTKERLALDEWAKDLAPSPELRRRYSHDVERFTEFARRYRAELRSPAAREELSRLAGIARTQPMTLLTATKDVDRSSARVLADTLLVPMLDG